MTSIVWRFVAVAFALAIPAFAHAQDAGEERRIALVIGNGEYEAGSLKTAANDAGLVAQTLQAAGFDVSGARDLDSDTLRDTIREFVDKARASGPTTVSFVYFAGRAVQFEGENYILPVDARIAKDTDIPLEGVRLSDLTKPLAQSPGKARIIVLDAARLAPPSFPKDGIAGGLALVQPEQGMAIAYNAAPGTVGPDEQGAYGSYATALVEMIKTGDYTLDDVFSRTRMRVADLTKGQQLPWYSSRVLVPFRFFEQAADAQPEARDKFDDLKSRPLRDFSAEDAYQAALARDTFAAYQEFLAIYPKDPLAKRVRAILAARREAMTWRETILIDTPEAYWSYLRRYPDGPHAYEARRRLAYFDVAYDPPPRFTEIFYDVPPPYDDEIIFVRRRTYIYFGDPYFDFPPPPLISIVFLLARPAYYIALPPPPPPPLFVLPMPIYYPVPVWVQRPRYVALPPPNLISVNIYNKVEVARDAAPIITSPKGERIPVKDFTPVIPRPGDVETAIDKKRPKPDAPLLGVDLPAAAEKKIRRLPKNAPQEIQPQVINPLKDGQQIAPDGATPENGGIVPKGAAKRLPEVPKAQDVQKTKELPKLQELPKVQEQPKQQFLKQRDLPKVQEPLKQQELPKVKEFPKSQELPKAQDLQKRQQPLIQEQPKLREQPRLQEQPKLREKPQFQEQPKLREQPRIQEQPKLRELPRIQEQPRQQQQEVPGRKKCGKPPLPPCE